VAESDLGDVGPGRYAAELSAQASVRALDEAGLTTRDVDGLFAVVGGYHMSTLQMGEYLGIRPRYTDSSMIGGSAFVSHLHHAALALQTGECDVALITYGSTPRADGARAKRAGGARLGGGVVEALNYEVAYRPRSPITGYALAAARHMHEFGTTKEQLGEVAVAFRQWAQLNPKAFVREPLSLDDYLSKPLISTPFNALDCCLVTDGGGAVVMTRSDRARELPQPPAYLLGAGEAHWHYRISEMPDLTTTATVQSSKAAFAQAGISSADVDLVELYDAFSINPILFLEDMGFCAKGEGGAFVSGGRIAPGGDLPVNTNGGGLSYCHPGMYGIFTIIEAVRQLRGEAGDRQVRKHDVAVAHGNGGQLSSQVTAVLGTDATL
jgi:acetyl-CoA acetyltransferase